MLTFGGLSQGGCSALRILLWPSDILEACYRTHCPERYRPCEPEFKRTSQQGWERGRVNKLSPCVELDHVYSLTSAGIIRRTLVRGLFGS